MEIKIHLRETRYLVTYNDWKVETSEGTNTYIAHYSRKDGTDACICGKRVTHYSIMNLNSIRTFQSIHSKTIIEFCPACTRKIKEK